MSSTSNIRGVVDQHWIYHLIGASGELLYVGFTRAPMQRLKDHARSKPWWDRVKVARWLSLGTCSGFEAFEEEQRQIRTLEPRYNIAPLGPEPSRLKTARLDAWLTQEELARRSEYSLPAVRAIENGSRVDQETALDLMLIIREAKARRQSPQYSG